MSNLLQNVVDNLAKGICKIKCRYQHDDKECETCGIRYNVCQCCLEYTNFKDDSVERKCLSCNENYQKKKKKDENLRKRFLNTYYFSGHDFNRFILLLSKGV